MTTTATRSKGDTAQAWRLRAWDDAELEQRFLSDRIIAISADEVGDLTDWPTEAQLRKRLSRSFPERTSQAIGTFVGYWRAFRVEMQPGDIVVVPFLGRRVAIGEVTGAYTYRAGEPNSRLRHQRTVQWFVVTDRAQLDDDLRKIVNAPGTICRMKGADTVSRLRNAVLLRD